MKYPDDVNDLFNKTPDELDQILKYESDKILNAANEENKPQLKQMQLKMNVIRSKNGNNHLKSAIDFTSLMWDYFFDLNDALQKFKLIEENDKKEVKESIFRIIK
jgi:hypothetical protein